MDLKTIHNVKLLQFIKLSLSPNQINSLLTEASESQELVRSRGVSHFVTVWTNPKLICNFFNEEIN